MRVRFTPAARTQFLSAIAYVRRENPQAAAALRQRADPTLRRLEQFPESDRIIPEFLDLPLSRGGRAALPVLLSKQGFDRVGRRSMARRTTAEEAMSINAGSAD